MKDQTIGRPGSTTSALVDDNDDDGHNTFPDNDAVSSGAAEANVPNLLAVSAEEDLAPEENIANGIEEPENNSGINSDDSSDDNSDDNSDDGSGNGSDCEGSRPTEDQPTNIKHPKKRPFRKVAYTKSSRRARDADVPLNENATPRKLNPTNIMADVVANLHPMRAMRPGRIESCLIHSLKESFPRPSSQDRDLLSSYILETMRTMARVHTDLLREGLLVTNLFIAKTFATFPAIEGDQGREHSEKRMEHFNNILMKGKRETFYQRLLYRLIRWDSDYSDHKKLKKASSPALVASDEIFQEYLQVTSQRQAPPFRLKDTDICGGSIMSQCARTLSDMVGGHLYKFSLELKKRVSHLNKSMSFEPCLLVLTSPPDYSL